MVRDLSQVHKERLDLGAGQTPPTRGPSSASGGIGVSNRRKSSAAAAGRRLGGCRLARPATLVPRSLHRGGVLAPLRVAHVHDSLLLNLRYQLFRDVLFQSPQDERPQYLLHPRQPVRAHELARVVLIPVLPTQRALLQQPGQHEVNQRLQLAEVVLQRGAGEEHPAPSFGGDGVQPPRALRLPVLHQMRLVQHQVRVVERPEPRPLLLRVRRVPLENRVTRDDDVEGSAARRDAPVPARARRPRLRRRPHLVLALRAVVKPHAQRGRPLRELAPPILQQRSRRDDQRGFVPGAPRVRRPGAREVGDGLRGLAEAHLVR